MYLTERRRFPLDGGPHGHGPFAAADLEPGPLVAELGPDGQSLPETALPEEMDVEPHGSFGSEPFDGQHVEHHLDVTHGIDMAVEVDVAVNDLVLAHDRRLDGPDFTRHGGRGRDVDDGVGMGVAYP